MVTPPQARPSLQLFGSVRLTIDDRHVDVTCRGSHVRAEVGDMPVGRTSLRTARSNYFLARRISRFLVRAALTVEITRHGRAVLELGAGVRSSPLARVLGIANVRIVRGNRSSGAS